MKTLIIKLGATGDVVRTTTLLHVLDGEIVWLTADKNIDLINSLPEINQAIPWSRRNELLGKHFDLIINLEDTKDVAEITRRITYKDRFGAYLNGSGAIQYTESSAEWFDISIISRFGIKRADELKLKNRKTYQAHIFEGLGYRFNGETYFLPETGKGDLTGDIAIAPKSGNVWPMKNWAYFDQLTEKLRADGYTVNYLPDRATLLEHIQDVRGHRYLIGGDSLPMHIALGSGIKCLSIFICTSPWEIYDYGLQKKIVSPLLDKHFYKREFHKEAAESISLDEVYECGE